MNSVISIRQISTFQPDWFFDFNLTDFYNMCHIHFNLPYRENCEIISITKISDFSGRISLQVQIQISSWVSFSIPMMPPIYSIALRSYSKNWYDRGMDIKLLRPDKEWYFPINHTQTMTIPETPWRKPPRPGKGDVICTRLILPAAVPTVKKHANQRGSVRTICPWKRPNRTNRERAWPRLLTVSTRTPPGNQMITMWLQLSAPPLL